MSETMTRWGVGPRLGLLSAVYAAPVFAVRLAWPAWFRMDFVPYWLLVILGVVMIGIGLPFWIAGVVTVMRGFGAGRLCTGGVFALCRHPVYASWVVFVVPGMMLLTNSWLCLTLPVVMYVLVRLLVREEEAYLERTLGDEYRAYRRRVPAVLPLGWLAASRARRARPRAS